MRTRPLATVAAALLVGLLAACGAEPDGSTNPNPVPGTNEFAQVDTDAHKLVTAQATWSHPQSLVVEKVTRIGLQIGTGAEITQKMNQLVKNAKQTSAGAVQVGPTVRVTLLADPEDAEITPSAGVDASTGVDLQMLWTWLVKAKHPTDDLSLTAHMEIPLSNGHVIANDLPLSLTVTRTFGYTVNQIATSWGTWSAVVASLLSVGAWLWARRHRLRRRSRAEEPAKVTV
ncbi:hypothetical protein [Hamadaea tsunoensis]|uniref:hypothetical protein n=1 Tax=Hamadaea tsunoensis TaxID=53368 RepID=UPI0003FA1E97|nr:hypothetical protein [Hamadaea tsunoensis]